MNLATFVKEKRKLVNLTQPALAAKAGVGLRFVRESKQGKESLRIDKVNQVLRLFGHEVGAVTAKKESITMRKAIIKIDTQMAGWLTQDEHEYHFE